MSVESRFKLANLLDAECGDPPGAAGSYFRQSVGARRQDAVRTKGDNQMISVGVRQGVGACNIILTSPFLIVVVSISCSKEKCLPTRWPVSSAAIARPSIVRSSAIRLRIAHCRAATATRAMLRTTSPRNIDGASVFPASHRISQRLHSIDDRPQFGHWEGDLLIFERELGHLTQLARNLKDQPRRCLGYRTPAGVFMAHLQEVG